MHLLLSGEGRGDIGYCQNNQSECVHPEFLAGAMTYIVDRLVESFIGYEYSHLEYNGVTFVSEQYLVANKLPPVRKAMALRGKKKPPETQYYYQNARALAAKAKALSETIGDKVVAVLFRDADGTASAGRGHWRHKIESMEHGFAEQHYHELGVPMIPMPKSEAWLLCALKNNPYQSCNQLESESGNDKAPDPLKAQLNLVLNGKSTIATHIELIQSGAVDVNQIDMNSFNYFKAKLRSAVKMAQQG